MIDSIDSDINQANALLKQGNSAAADPA